MKKIFLFLIILSCFKLSAQEVGIIKHKKEIGIEVEKYPVGIISAITYNYFFKETWALRFRLGGNFADRKDVSGLNDNEIANGFGGSFGVNKYVSCWKGNFIFGANLDVWNTWTKWIDYSEVVQEGKTYTLVIQPWINAGYLYNFSDKLNGGLNIGFGKEINAITRGERVGQGLMGSVSILLNYRLN